VAYKLIENERLEREAAIFKKGGGRK
jgi:hypothetical protein